MRAVALGIAIGRAQSVVAGVAALEALCLGRGGDTLSPYRTYLPTDVPPWAMVSGHGRVKAVCAARYSTGALSYVLGYCVRFCIRCWSM